MNSFSAILVTLTRGGSRGGDDGMHPPHRLKNALAGSHTHGRKHRETGGLSPSKFEVGGYSTLYPPPKKNLHYPATDIHWAISPRPSDRCQNLQNLVKKIVGASCRKLYAYSFQRLDPRLLKLMSIRNFLIS